MSDRVDLPTSPEEFVLLALLAGVASVLTRDALAALPLVTLALSPVSLPVATRRVYRPEPDETAATIFNASEAEDEERVLEADVALNAGGAAALAAAVYLSLSSPLEAVTVFLATLPVAYLSSRPVTGVGPVQVASAALVPVLVALLLESPVSAAAGGVPAMLVAQAAAVSREETRETSSTVFSLGGRGVFVPLFLVLLLAVVLAAV